MTDLEKLKQWIVDNHEHHTQDFDADNLCPNGDRPYVDSLELEKFIISLENKS